jgi:hypothetical protein
MAVAHFAGSNLFASVILGLAPQALCFRPLRGLYEHQNPLLSVAWLIGLHLPGPGLPVVPQSRQIQESPF